MLSIEQPVEGYKTEKHIILRCTTGISAFFHGGVSEGGGGVRRSYSGHRQWVDKLEVGGEGRL